LSDAYGNRSRSSIVVNMRSVNRQAYNRPVSPAIRPIYYISVMSIDVCDVVVKRITERNSAHDDACSVKKNWWERRGTPKRGRERKKRRESSLICRRFPLRVIHHEGHAALRSSIYTESEMRQMYTEIQKRGHDRWMQWVSDAISLSRSREGADECLLTIALDNEKMFGLGLEENCTQRNKKSLPHMKARKSDSIKN